MFYKFNFLLTENTINYITEYFKNKNKTNKIIRLNVEKLKSCNCLKTIVEEADIIRPISDVIFNYPENIHIIMDIGTAFLLKASVLHVYSDGSISALKVYNQNTNFKCDHDGCN